MSRHDPTGKRKRYLRKRHLRERYGDITDRSLERWIKAGKVPPPDFYQGRIPFWEESTLDKSDRRAAVAPSNRPTS